MWYPPINQTCLHYFRTWPSSIQAFFGLLSNQRERTYSWVSYLTMDPAPLACCPQSVQDPPSPAGPELTLAPHLYRTQTPLRIVDKDCIPVGKAIHFTFTAGRLLHGNEQMRLAWCKYNLKIKQIKQRIYLRGKCAQNIINHYGLFWIMNVLIWNLIPWNYT